MRLAVVTMALLALSVPAAAAEMPAEDFRALSAPEYTPPARPVISNPTPIWEHLAQLTPAERANAEICFHRPEQLARDIEADRR